MPKRILALLGAAALVTACGGAGATGSDGTQVVASFYPLEYVADRVAGEHADVTGLAAPGAEPHDLELSFAQTADVAGADVVVYLRGFQPAVDDAVEQASDARLVEAGAVADAGPGGAGHDESEEGGRFHDHDDPHFWLDPTRLADVAAAVEQQLAETDPEHADDYADNLAALEADLDTLDQEIIAGLESCARDTIVSGHDAFAYFSDRYGVGVEAISGLTPGAEPSPARLRELAGLIRERGITTVFTETIASPDLADTLADELGLRTAVLDPVEGLTEATQDEDYLSLMRANLAAIQQANECR